ncbi:MAG: DUF445 family protein [Spirochaetes bacterium]|nr:DUF445 family protein [Spirochaetota bacterium]
MSSPLTAVLLSWIAPPVVGAVIGWITNDIAIRMLFRPLRAVRVLGIRLPLTPGIIPKERRTLAVSIGSMVSRELITEDALRSQVHEPRTLAALAESVSGFTAGLLEKPVGTLAADAKAVLPSPLEGLLAEVLGRAATSRSFIGLVHDLVGRAVSALAGMRVSEAAARFDLERFLDERLLSGLAGRGKDAGKAVADLVADRGVDLLTDEAIVAAVRLAEPLLPDAVERLVAWARTAETRAAIGREALTVLASAVDRLNLVQRLIVGAAQFDRRLDERMPEIVDEIVASLERLARDPANQGRLLEAAGGALRDWRDGLAGDPRRVQAFAEAASGFLGRFSAGLADPARRHRFAAFLAGRIARGNATIGGLTNRTLGFRESDAAEFASNRVLGWLSREGTAGQLSRGIAGMAHRFVEENAEVPLGRLLGVDERLKAGLDSFLTGRLVALIDAKLPEILRGVDVEDLVVRKIDALDVRDVERLLMQVLASHLKWINVFGAILGAVIGFAQVLIGLVAP